MFFVGIITDSKDYEFIKSTLLKITTKSQIDLINVNPENIENMRNIKFDMLIICNNISKMDDKIEYINNLLSNARYLVINSDEKMSRKIDGGNNLQVITYGNSQKATLTVSSVQEDTVLACLQRAIKNIRGNIIDMQEMKINSENITNNKVYNLLVCLIIKMIYL